MPTPATILLTLLLAYLIGSVPFGYLVARARGVDIFAHGSGNLGATNVGRVLGRKFGVVVFLLDFAKGAFPVAAACWVVAQRDPRADLLPGLLPVGAGLAAFLGHLYPIYLRFRGGKGVATGAGVVAVLLPGAAAGAAIVWLAVLFASRTASLASMLAGTALCLFRIGLTTDPFAAEQVVVTAFCFVAAGLVVVRHRANLGRLARGTENRVKDTPTMQRLTKIVHVLALGLWFGSGVFFSLIAAPLLFQTFEGLGNRPANERPSYLSLPSDFNKESGTRLAGAAVGPIFPWYFALQGACGLLAVGTALSWVGAGRKVHRVRAAVVVIALLLVLAGWPVVEKVSQLRGERYAAEPAVAAAAREAFAGWHLLSLAMNLVTVALVGVAMAQSAWLPAASRPETVTPP